MPIPVPGTKITKKAVTELQKTTIQNALNKHPVFVERALVALLARQTATEQEYKETNEENGVGFSGTDAEFLTSLAEWVIKSHKKEGERLTEKQLGHARKKLQKYWRQLAEIAAEKGKEIKPKPVGQTSLPV